MESKEVTAFIVMDLSVAFDHFGIINNALSWCDTYLCPRQLYMNFEDHKSSNKPLNFSVPRGVVGAYSVHGILQHVIHQANRID